MSETHNHYKFATAFLVLVLSITLQFALQFSFPLSRGLPLVALLALASFFRPLQILFFSACVAFVVNGSPAPSRELVALVLVPVAASFFATFLPVRPWARNMLVVFLSTLFFYAFTHGSLALEYGGAALQTALVALIPGVLVFGLFSYAYGSLRA